MEKNKMGHGPRLPKSVRARIRVAKQSIRAETADRQEQERRIQEVFTSLGFNDDAAQKKARATRARRKKAKARDEERAEA